MASPSIELKNLGIQFPDETKPLLSGINLSIAAGECFVIVGPSGQGKSVLLKMMSGILEPTQGEVFIEGHELNSIKPKLRDQVLQKMGMLFQKNALFDSLTSAENVAFPLREVKNEEEDVISEKVDRFLQDVAIAHAKNLYPDEISGGMQKRLGIARALVLDPEIIFYDDPTAGLDPITSRLIIDLIMRLQKQNSSTVVAITNDMNRAFQMADRIGFVADGELIVAGTPEQTKSHQDPRVHQFILGELTGPLSEAQ